MQSTQSRRWPLGLALAACLAATPALATVMRAEQLNVYRDGTSASWLAGGNRLLGDGFDNGDPLVGAVFSSTGNPATYDLLGETSAAAALEQNGQLLLDPNLGAVAANAAGNTATSVRLRLLTNTTDPTGGLNIGRSFAATLRLALSAAPDPGQSFGLRLNDAGIGSDNNDVVELFWAGNASGGNIVLRKQDFTNSLVTVLGVTPVVAPTGAAMLVLSLSHTEVNDNSILGSYNYADSTGALLGNFTGFSTRATAFNGENHTRVELRATGVSAPIPEPATSALMAAGAALLLWRRRTRQPG